MLLEVTRGAFATLLAEANGAHPLECCGLLLGRRSPQGRECIDRALRAANHAADPSRHFEIDPAVLIAAHRGEREGGPGVLGYYHSHPTGQCLPSATDLAHSTGDLRIWSIIAGDTVAFWRDTGNGFRQLTYRVTDVPA